MSLSCYYAHCMALYNTLQEARDVDALEAMGFEVFNPNTPEVQDQCVAVKGKGEDVMTAVFRPLVTTCDVFAFRALPDGMIPSGVFKELWWAREEGIPVIELPSGILRRELSLGETREYLAEVGER